MSSLLWLYSFFSFETAILYHHSYSPSPQSPVQSSSSTTTAFTQVKLASLHPLYYHLVSSEILSKIPDLGKKRVYYGPHASLIFSCGSGDFLTESGFPLPEIHVEIRGNTDVSQLGGLLRWNDGVIDSSLMTVTGPVTRSHSASASAVVSATASLEPTTPG